MEELPSNDSINSKRQKKASETECRICEGPAKFMHYGAIACDACKIFFRRNAEQGRVN